MSSSYGMELLRRQLLELSRNPPDGVSVGLDVDENIFHWKIMIIGPSDTPYEGGFFPAKLEFPQDFPNSPPVMTFTGPIWHPNVYPDGKVCISILHPPGEDQFNELEKAEERWRPILSVEAIIVSVVSMLSNPNDESPANIDAAVMWRNEKKTFNRRVREIVRQSQDEC